MNYYWQSRDSILKLLKNGHYACIRQIQIQDGKVNRFVMVSPFQDLSAIFGQANPVPFRHHLTLQELSYIVIPIGYQNSELSSHRTS